MELVVGQFNDSYEPLMDGVVNVTKNYAYWLNKSNCKSYVITPHYPNYEDSVDFEVLRYFSLEIPVRKPYRLGMPKIDLPFIKKVNAIPFNIVHAHCPFSSGQIALRLARKRGIPIVTTFHSKLYDDFKQAVKSEHLSQLLLDKVMNFYNEVDFVWAVSKSTAETLKSYGFKGNIEIVPNGTDFLPPKNIAEYSKLAERRLHLASEDLVLLFVGQHIWQKNLKMLLQSLQILKNMGVKYKMLFAGSGYAENYLKKLTDELQLTDCVTFLGLVTDREYLKSLFARADLFLFPSVYDNAPIVIREAAAVNCPSLVIENSNASEGIKDNYNGFLAPDNPELFARKIKNIVINKDLMKNTGSAAQLTLYKNWEQILWEVRGRYEDIVKTYKKIDVV
jgi:1,2-diacylglycerol 3-alpha-glucosyltransferase